MDHRRLLTALLTLGWLLSTFSVASGTTPPSKSLEILSEPGDFVGQGLEYSFSGSDATFEAYQSFNNQARFRVFPRDGGFWVLQFGAPIGQSLVPGTYDGALRSNTFSPESPTLDIGGNGRGCNQSFGSFVVNDARFDGLYGDLIGFDAAFEIRCERTDAPALRGHIHYSVDSTAPVLSPIIDPAPNAEGWNTTSVVVTWTVSDPESGIAWEDCAPTTISHETYAHAAFCRAQNGDGRISLSHIAVHIDKTAPTLTFSGNAGSYSVDQIIDITCSADDLLSGIAAVGCPAITSVPASNYVGGTRSTTTTLAAAAMDRAGNTAAASTAFTVTVTANGICGLTKTVETEQAVCALATAIAKAPNAQAKAGILSGLDRYLAAQRGKSIPADRADLLSRLAHLL
jgi:hypothetical protein